MSATKPFENPISLDPAIRGELSPDERLELYIKFIATGQKVIQARHKQGGGGTETCSAQAAMLDSLLSTIFTCKLAENNIVESPLALVAVGGYGRGILNPGSDIDILFLLPRASTKLPKPIREVVQRVLYVLWDMGFKVGHSCRSIVESIEEARADEQNFTALMDTRLIAGNTELYEKLSARFDKECIQKNNAAFLESRRQDLRSRYTKSSHTVFLQEPNVKESCGGLRDYQNILWIARIKTGSSDLQNLVTLRHITADTRCEIEAAHDFLLRVRNELHYHSGKGTDILTLQLQGIVATAFKYPQRSILRRIEVFMKDYYTHTRHLYRHSTSLMELFELQENYFAETGLRSYLTFRKKNREQFDGFHSKDGLIYPDNEDIFTDDTQRLMRLFQHCQQRDLSLSPQMRRLVADHWDDIDRPFRYAKANRDTFQAILERKGQVAATLRQMHRIGFLGRYLPEFGALDCLVQHEFFHRYTADEHTLRCIDSLDSLVDTQQKENLQTFHRLFHAVRDPYALYLAFILHDTGRSENVREHIDGSAMLAARLCTRLHVKGKRRALIMFLVDNHLTFWRTATTKNLEDPEVIADFARIMKTTENLDTLLLFTFCDTNGTAPDAWNSWKESLMLQLHKATRHFLKEGREQYNRKLDTNRSELRDEVTKILKDSYKIDIAEHFERMPDTAFDYRGPSFISKQVLAVRAFLEAEKTTGDPHTVSVKWFAQPEKGYSHLIVVSRDRPLHLEKICCALASQQINILSADLITRTDHIVFNNFRVCNENFEPITSEATQKRFLETFHKIAAQTGYDPELYLKRKTNFLKPRPEEGLPPVPTHALVSNHLHPTCTTVEIQALDRIGLLHDLFHTVNQYGLDTSHARICTEKGVAVDTLYITTSDDKKIGNPAILKHLTETFTKLAARPA